VLEDVTDALGGVAAALGSSGLVEVDKGSRLFGMHQLLQKAVRAEMGDRHDDAMAALLEARCGCMGDEVVIDYRMYGVMREVVGAAGHVLGRMKAAAAQRAAWVCSMRVRVMQLARAVIGAQSLEVRAYYDALNADLSALGVERGGRVEAEYRAMKWWRGCFSGDERSDQALVREVEEAAGSAADAAAGWDCRAALGSVQQSSGSYMFGEGQYDRAIELFERALRIQEATLGEMHADTAGTIMSMGVSYSEKRQYDQAIELYERALRIQKATLGEMHASTAATISSMGVSYSKKGQHDRAIAETERALRICREVLGPNHPQTMVTQQNLSTIRSAAAGARSGRGRR
jgi:hypothetical protein